MTKRVIAAVLGTIAAFGSLLPLGYAFEVFREFQNPNVSVWSNILGGLLLTFMALTGFVIGFRFLQFAAGHRFERTSGWGRPLLLGAAFFFPGFVFSIPVTMLLAHYVWPGDDGKVDLAGEVSLGAGAIAAIICTVVLFRKRGTNRTF